MLNHDHPSTDLLCLSALIIRKTVQLFKCLKHVGEAVGYLSFFFLSHSGSVLIVGLYPKFAPRVKLASRKFDVFPSQKHLNAEVCEFLGTVWLPKPVISHCTFCLYSLFFIFVLLCAPVYCLMV